MAPSGLGQILGIWGARWQPHPCRVRTPKCSPPSQALLPTQLSLGPIQASPSPERTHLPSNLPPTACVHRQEQHGELSISCRPSPCPGELGGSRPSVYHLSTARGAVLPELGRHTFLDEHKTPCQEPTGSQCLPWQYEREPGEAGGSFLECQPRQACRLTHHVWSLVPPSAGGTHLRSTAHSPGSEF